MIKSELGEIKKLYTPKNCSVTRIAGCYVDAEKNKKAVFAKPFTQIPEEEMYKYFDIFRKALSGTVGKSALTLDIMNEAEKKGGQQEFLLKLRESGLKDDDLLDDYYNRIISSFEYVGNYLILVAHDIYDVPGKTKDGAVNDDASDDVYEYILTVICPVDLTEAALSFDPKSGEFHDRKRDWIVKLPALGYLFPAFNDRGSDIHSVMYYSKDAENLNEQFIELMQRLKADARGMRAHECKLTEGNLRSHRRRDTRKRMQLRKRQEHPRGNVKDDRRCGGTARSPHDGKERHKGSSRGKRRKQQKA